MHGITKNDNMFYVGEVPWHKLGTKLDNLATADEAIKAANLGWTVLLEPIQRNGIDVPGHFFTVREDTNEVLGHVTSRYTPVQNLHCFRLFDAITKDPNGPKFVTAGSLFGGRKIWMLAKIPSFIEVVGHDVVEEYLLLSSSHDGSEGLSVLWTTVRVVCNNTLTSALQSSAGGYKYKHTSGISMKVEEIQDILGIVNKKHDTLLQDITTMRQWEPTEEQVDAVICGLLPELEKNEVSTRLFNARSKIKELVYTGKGNDIPGVADTGWALLNGVTEYVDHYKKAKSLDTHMENTLYGSGAKLKEDAYNTILELARSLS